MINRQTMNLGNGLLIGVSVIIFGAKVMVSNGYLNHLDHAQQYNIIQYELPFHYKTAPTGQVGDIKIYQFPSKEYSPIELIEY
jgi:hypothetical protein